MFHIEKYNTIIIILLFIGIILIYIFYPSNIESMENKYDEDIESNPYLTTLIKHKDEKHFPFRYMQDENGDILPIVCITAFFRDDKERVTLYDEYVNNNIQIIGATMYKSFPRPITDTTGDSDTKNDSFNYYNIKDWLCCFKNNDRYGFNSSHNLIDISESDFYDADLEESVIEKKYDMIYSCLDDDEKTCPQNGWNAVNRNFDLFKKCLPIIINEFKMKVMILGRQNCGLEELYGDRVEIKPMLPYPEFQQKLKESKILFIPNHYDASPRVISESIIKNVPVLMNENILCGSKYINHETGEFFTDEHNIRFALTQLLSRINIISPKKWWITHYSRQKSGKKMRNFLYNCSKNKDVLENVKEVYFI